MGQRTKAPNPPVNEVRDRIPDSRRDRRLLPGLATFVGPYAVWAVTLAGIILLPWWAKVPLALVNGVAIGVLFLAGHDAGHGSLLPRRWMNRLVGRLALLPSLHPFAAWVHNHNGLHHGFTNIRERDPGFPPLALDEYRALPWWHRWLHRRYRTWYGLGLLYFVEMWLKWEVLPAKHRSPRNPKAYQLDRLLVVLFAAAWVGGLVAAAIWTEQSAVGLVLIGFVVPYAVWNWVIGFLILQQHTHPRVPWYSALDKPSPTFFEAQVQATPYLWFPAPVRWVMRNIMEHTAHHADPMVPLYELPAAQTDLTKAYRRDMVRVIWTRKEFLRMLRTCRLYDYADHRWLDYDGTPTTEQLLKRPEQIAVGEPGA